MKILPRSYFSFSFVSSNKYTLYKNVTTLSVKKLHFFPPVTGLTLNSLKAAIRWTSMKRHWSHRTQATCKYLLSRCTDKGSTWGNSIHQDFKNYNVLENCISLTFSLRNAFQNVSSSLEYIIWHFTSVIPPFIQGLGKALNWTGRFGFTKLSQRRLILNMQINRQLPVSRTRETEHFTVLGQVV